MGCSFRKFDFLGKIPDADSLRALSQGIENERDSFNGLDEIVRFRSLRGCHAFRIVEQYSLLQYIFCKPLSRVFMMNR